MMLKRSSGRFWFWAALLGIGGIGFALALVLLNSNLLRVEGRLAEDIRIFQAAGMIWAQGHNAYDVQNIQRLNISVVLPEVYDFVYPPNLAPFCLFIALFPLNVAFFVLAGLNNLAAIATSLFAVRLTQQGCRKLYQTCGKFPTFVIPILVMGNPLTHSVVLSSQTTLIVGLALISGWYYAQKQRWILSGCLLGIACIKPQLGLLIVLWFILERRWKLLFSMSLVIFLSSLLPLIVAAPHELVTHWSINLARYQSIDRNQLGSFGLFGIQNFLYEANIRVPNLLPIAIILTFLIWRWRHKFLMDDIPAILISLALLFGYCRSYDLAILPPFLLAAFWKYWQNRPRQIAIAAILGILVFLPRLILRSFITSELLLQYRVPIVLIFTIWLCIASIRQGGQQTIAVELFEERDRNPSLG